MTTGFLIALEGIDGAGTTTQVKKLASALEQLGHACHATREPSDGPVGKLLRQVLEKQMAAMDATTMSLLFAADRANHIESEVLPAMKAGKIVISDRWYHSSLAYQGTDEDREWIRQLNQRALRPNLTIFLKVDPLVAEKRRHGTRDSQELYESQAMQQKVAAGYDAVMALLSPNEPIVVVNGQESPQSITQQILATALLALDATDQH